MHGLNDYKECVNPVIGKPQAKANILERILGNNQAAQNGIVTRKGIASEIEIKGITSYLKFDISNLSPNHEKMDKGDLAKYKYT